MEQVCLSFKSQSGETFEDPRITDLLNALESNRTERINDS